MRRPEDVDHTVECGHALPFGVTGFLLYVARFRIEHPKATAGGERP